MPVVATLTLMALLRDDGDSLTFTSPGLLRERLLQAMTPAAEHQSQALELADQLDHQLLEYQAALDRSIEAYEEYLYADEPDTSGLDPVLGREDAHRLQKLLVIVDIRESLLSLLTEAEWRAVFD